jgi:CheY-like chemotaxis protein
MQKRLLRHAKKRFHQRKNKKNIFEWKIDNQMPNGSENMQKEARILYVSAHPISQKLMTKFMGKNCVVDIANDAKEAAQKIIANGYSAVVSDLNIHYINGVEVLKFTRDFKGGNFPTILLSAVQKSEVLAQYPDLNRYVNEFVLLPYDGPNLVKMILNYADGYLVTAKSN